MSLGFNCFAKMYMVRGNIANNKKDGGKTFPFDKLLSYDTE
jgi:hypothetical protein